MKGLKYAFFLAGLTDAGIYKTISNVMSNKVIRDSGLNELTKVTGAPINEVGLGGKNFPNEDDFGFLGTGGAGTRQMIYCFAEDSWVTRKDGSTVAMRALSEQDRLLSPFVRDARNAMRLWLHLEQSVQATFQRLSTESGASLLLSPGHLVYVSRCYESGCGPRELRQAAEVRAAEHWMYNVALSAWDKVSRNEPEAYKGAVFAPLTDSGDLAVNSLAVSSFTAVDKLSHKTLYLGGRVLIAMNATLRKADWLFSALSKLTGAEIDATSWNPYAYLLYKLVLINEGPKRLL